MNEVKKIPVFEMFEIKVQANIPCELTYRVRAENTDNALKMIEKQAPTNFRPMMMRKRLTSAKVYTAGSIMLRATKTYRQ